jgi:glycerophosphoryl diester phosphodiesterase
MSPIIFLKSKYVVYSNGKRYTQNQGLVIERDNSQGDMHGFKMVYKITLKANGEMVEKQPVVNLLKIADPNGISQGESGEIGIGTTFGFPFFTIESVVVLNNNQIGVLNDNNYPFSVGRHVGNGQPDDNEFIIIKLDERVLR